MPTGAHHHWWRSCLERVLDAAPPPVGLHEPDGARDRAGRIVFQPEAQRQVEQDLAVGLPLDLGEQRFIDRQHQVALDHGEAVDEPVVHPQPAAIPERMAVGLLNRRPDRRPDVGEEQVRAHVPGELTRVLVIPGRLDAAEEPRRGVASYQPTPNPSPLVVSAPASSAGSGRSANAPACRARR